MFKSGTASGYFSLWCLGAARAHTVGVWAGNLDRRSAPGATGSSVPAAVARGLLEELQERPGRPADRAGRGAARSAAGAGGRRICTLTASPASPWPCPATRKAWANLPSAPAGPRRQGLEALTLELFLRAAQRARVLYPGRGDVLPGLA